MCNRALLLTSALPACTCPPRVTHTVLCQALQEQVAALKCRNDSLHQALSDADASSAGLSAELRRAQAARQAAEEAREGSAQLQESLSRRAVALQEQLADASQQLMVRRCRHLCQRCRAHLHACC